MARGRKQRVIAGMSGAQAAAADLLRARQDDIETTDVDPAMIDAARQVVAAAETYFKSSRTYPEGYPARERFLAAIDEKLRAYLVKYEELVLSLTARTVEVEAEIVADFDRPDHNMWFPLYRDGVRELTFNGAVTRDEIVRLFKALLVISALRPGDAADDGEDDAVTILWDLDLPHISYVAVDTFFEDVGKDGDAAARVERVREIVTISMMKEIAHTDAQPGVTRDAEQAKRLKSIALSKADLTFLESENLASLERVSPRLRDLQGTLYAIADDDKRQLADGLAANPALVQRFVDAMIRSLVTEGGSQDVDAVCTRIEQCFTAAVVDGAFALAADLRRRVTAVIAGSQAAPEVLARVEAATAADAAIAAIVTAVGKRADDEVADVLALIELLPPAAARALIAGFPKIADRKRRRRICDVVATWGAVALDAASDALPNSTEDEALDLLYLLRKVGGDRAIRVLAEASRHPAAQVRAGALRLYMEVAPPNETEPRARIALRDSDPLVRAIGLEVIAARKPANGVAWVKELIAADGFAKRDFGEKLRLFFTYATVGGAAAAVELLERLNQRNLLMRTEVEEERAAAARALGQVGYHDARPALEKLVGTKLVRGVLQDACREAIAALDAAEQRGSEPGRG